MNIIEISLDEVVDTETQYYWGSCYLCKKEYCIYTPEETEEKAFICDDIVENVLNWWFVDGTWICEECC